MPHFTVEYSANLDGQLDIAELCHVILESALATGLFEIGAVRVRALRAEYYAIADENPQNSFIDLSLRMGQGRSPDDKKRAGDAIFAAICAYLSQLFATSHFALSFEIREIDTNLSWKRNMMHSRLRGV